MNQLPKPKYRVYSPLVLLDLEQEKIMRSLQPPSEICPEENEVRVANRRYSDVLPLRATSGVSVRNRPQYKDVTDNDDRTSPRIVSAPLPHKVNDYPSNTIVIAPLRSPNKQDTFDPVDHYIIHPSRNIHPSISGIFLSNKRQNPYIGTPIGDAHFGMPAHIPPHHPKLHPYHSLASHPPGFASTVPSYLPREDSGSSLLSLEGRDTSIRIVKPNLTLSPPNKTKLKDNKENASVHSTSGQPETNQQTIMYKNKQTDQKGQHTAAAPCAKSEAVDKHSRSYSRSGSQHKQSFDMPAGYEHSRGNSINSLLPKSERSTRNGNVRSDSTDRGRTMQRRYEFIDSDDKTNVLLSPVHEVTKKNSDDDDDGHTGKAGHESNITSITDLMQQCMEHSPPPLPAHTYHQQQQTNGDISASATQISLPQSHPKTKRRPAQLNLRNHAFVGIVNRNTNHYQVEHNAIESSKAEQFDLYAPNADSPVYGSVEDGPSISPLNIPKCNATGISNSLQSYAEWRENLKLAHSESQGSIRITLPTPEKDTFIAKGKHDEDHHQKRDYLNIQDMPIVSHVRSRSALGIREDGNKDDRHHLFSRDSAYSDSEYSAALHTGQGSALTRSATMHEVSHRRRQYSDGSESKASRNDTLTNDVIPHKEIVIPHSPYTPLTPFIMRVSGAPAGVEQGAKTLFGEHGWLEDTAALGGQKPKIEKAGGFMESLKRKARVIADSTAFKPVRNRSNSVNRLNISLDAREQSLLYCELEYNLNNALDAYIKVQLNSGRLEASKLSRIADAWAQKGRPKVVGFRYDLETQVDLIAAHINDFRFYGPLQAEGPAAIAGLLYAMKTNARYMRIRTFCQPDSVIAKHVLDSQNFLRLLGSPESAQRPLEEVAQFFKVAVDRRKALAGMPAARQGGGRDASDGSGRIISNGSGQRVRFQDDSERRRPFVQIPAASKSRPDVREAYNGSVQSQISKPRSERRGLNH